MGRVVERQVPNRRIRPCAPINLTEDAQVLQCLGKPKALGDIDVGGSFGIRLGDIPDSSISSSGDPQILLETRHSTGGTGLIFLVTGHSPGIEVRLQSLGSEVIIGVAAIRVVSVFLEMISVPLQDTNHRQLGSPGNMPPF